MRGLTTTRQGSERFADPLPHSPPTKLGENFGLKVVHQPVELRDPLRAVTVKGRLPSLQRFKGVAVVLAEGAKFWIGLHSLADYGPVHRQVVENMLQFVRHRVAWPDHVLT